MSKKVALVLGSGGARGLAHIGAIEVLEEKGYEVDAIAGTSIGAVIGGLYAVGSLPKYKEWILNLDKFGVFKLIDLTLSSNGFIKGDKVFEEMRKFTDFVNIEELDISFKAVAADIRHRKEVVFDRGNLYDAMRASMAIPSVLTPHYIGEQVLVDGGVMNPLPVNRVKRKKGDLLVAIDLCSDVTYKKSSKKESKRSEEMTGAANSFFSKIAKQFVQTFQSNSSNENYGYFTILNMAFDQMQDQLTRVILEQTPPDILIEISRQSCDTFDFHKGEELIQYGRDQALKAIEQYESANH